MADITTGPILRQKTFLWSGVAPTYVSQIGSVQQGFALGTANGPQATSALVLALPDWSSQALANPWLLSQALFPGLAAAMGAPGAAIDLAGTALRVDGATNGALLALQAKSANNPLAEPQALLLGLSELDASPLINWSSLLPREDIIQLLPLNSSPSAGLVTVGTSLAGQGAITTAYTFGTGTAPTLSSLWRAFNAGPSDINAQATDAAVLPSAIAGSSTRLIQVATVQATTTSGLVPNGGQDVLITALAADGSRIWEKLFGNASAEQEPRLAIGSDGSIVVGASLRGSFGLNPAAGAQDIGLASYNHDGSLRWQKLLGDSGDQLLTDISIASDGTVMVLGLTTGSLSGLYGQSLKGDGKDYDSFLTAYSPQGDRLWTYQFGSAGDDLALAMAWMPRADGSANAVDTLVVVGSQAAPAAPDQPRAWVELLEVQPTSRVASFLQPPRPPTISWSNADLDPTLNLPLAVLSGPAATIPKLQLQGLSEPGSTLLVRTSLGSGITTTSADPISGSWSLSLELPQLSVAQLGQGFVVVEARNPQGLVSDATATPVLFTGTGLPGELPQVLPIDPDGASGVLPPVLLQRQITRLGSGPLTSAGQRLLVDYSGTLTNGTLFDSSLKPGRRPFDLTLGAGRVITGWDLGLQGLPMGSQVRLVIPPSLAYGDRATGTIPAGSTLVFDVDLRADLSVPDTFLRDVVWPILYSANYNQTNSALLSSAGQDLIGLALSYGPGGGSTSNDLLRVQSVQGFPAAYPLLAMGGVGNDQLIGQGQPLLAFGELGNDQLSSGNAPYAFLDGGDGDDRFDPAALMTWARGGSGIDSVILPSGDWRQLESGTVAGEPWRELGRFDASGNLAQLLDLQSVELLNGSSTVLMNLLKAAGTTGLGQITLQLSDTATTSTAIEALLALGTQPVQAPSLAAISGTSTELLAFYAASASGRLSGLGNALGVTVGDSSCSAAALNTLNGKTSAAVNATAVTTLTGAVADLKDVYAAAFAGEITGLGNEAVIVSDATVSASDLLLLDARTSGVISAAGVTALTGSALERNRVFHSAGIAIGLRDDQAPAIAQLVAVPADGTYGPGQLMAFQLAFDEPLQVSGVPILPLSNGLKASYDPGRSTLGQGLLAFSYTPQNGDQSTDLLIAAGASLALPLGAAITDQAGNAAPLTVPGFDAGVVVDAVVPQLQQLGAPGGTYGPNRALRMSLQFNEPVGWQADSPGSVPVLQLSQGLSAAWVAPSNGSPLASTQSFDLLTGTSPPDVVLLQVLGLAGQGHFVDGAGNPLVAPPAGSWVLPEPISLKASSSWTLDVDGDGKVNALGDGLMVIRKLFGASFSGDSLTAKAISSKATRSTADIHAYIQQGIDQGLLDIDRDGRTTALGDGLMLIRQLFGASFSGDALINKAISASSTLIPQGQSLGGLDPTGRMALADQVRGVINQLMPADPSTF